VLPTKQKTKQLEHLLTTKHIKLHCDEDNNFFKNAQTLSIKNEMEQQL